MSYAALPDAAEVENKLRSITFWPEGGDDDPQVLRAKSQTGIAAAAAADEWEHETGFYPFVSPAGAPDEARTFYPDRDRFARAGVLPLHSGLLRLSSVTVDGVAVDMTKVRQKPDHAHAHRRPVQWLQFPWLYPRLRRGVWPLEITVVGRWGYCAAEDGVPADVFSTVLDRATLITLLGVENPRDISNLSQDGFNIAWDPVGPLDPKTILANLGKQFEKVAHKYKRLVVAG
jgi:hypothetical protein